MKKYVIICTIIALFFAINTTQNKPEIPTNKLTYKTEFPQLFVRKEKVTVTIYNAVKEQCDETPGILADGTKINPRDVSSLRFCALSRDLLKRWGGRYSFGDTIVLKGIGVHSGYWVVRDVMNARHEKMVDLLVPRGTANIREPNIHIYTHHELEF